MANSVVPTIDALMWPALVALRELGGSASHAELLDKVVENEGISEDAQRIMHVASAGWTKLSFNLGVVKLRLGRASLIEAGRATKRLWILTEKGRNTRDTDLGAALISIRKLTLPSGAPAADLDPDPSREDAWKIELLSVLGLMAPDAFERLAQRILRESGFYRVEVTKKSNDGGIDGFGALRIANLVSFHVHFQCKRYKDAVGSEIIRNFRGAMDGRSDKGVVITTATFTLEAKKEAARDGAKPIDLIDGDRLCGLLKDLSLGVTTRQIEEIAVDPEWFRQI